MTAKDDERQQIIMSLKRLLSLLEDPHPGLSVWHSCVSIEWARIKQFIEGEDA